MNKKFQQIRKTLNLLDKMQADHIDSFDTQLMPNLELQSEERKKTFNCLNQEFKLFLKNTEQFDDADTKTMVSFFIQRIEMLMNQNRLLEKKVREYRDNLKEHMKSISKGKKAIGSYGSPSSISNRPRAISLTN